MKTITEILDDPRMEALIAEKIETIRGDEAWEYLSRRDMLSPTSVIY